MAEKDKKQLSRDSLEYVVASKSCLSIEEDLVLNTVDAHISLRIKREENKKIDLLDHSLSSKNLASDIDGELNDRSKLKKMI